MLLSRSRQQYRGGVLANSGSGWHVDAAAAAALGTGTPYAIAALPDGGAAVGVSGALGGSTILEREAPGAAWQSTPTPFPSLNAPSSLSAFRENGQLRVVASGSVPDTAAIESEEPPPPGSPPIQEQPYPVETPASQGVLRQTATGWSDEEHELNDVKEPPGHYLNYDAVYQPDPVEAVMVDETGAHGWAVGGFVDPRPELDTADVSRYPNDGTTPPATGTAPIALSSGALATFAVGGNAGCEAPCAAEQNAKLGPDVWLTSALARAASIPGVDNFIYTGPRLTPGSTAGPATLPIPVQEETERYAELIDTFPFAVPVPSGTDAVGTGSESTFQNAFRAQVDTLQAGLSTGEPWTAGCATPGCSYYAFTSGKVRVIVLDENAPVNTAQLDWLKKELGEGAAAIVVGSANLPALVSAGVGWAQQVAAVMQAGRASGYFFDAPEENIHLQLAPNPNLPAVPAYGSGTLGYVNYLNERQKDFHGASGFLLVGVGNRGTPVNVRLIPSISQLAIEPVEGTILQRSQVALFEGLARRPLAGNRAHNQAVIGVSDRDTDPYIPIPANCQGADCQSIAMEPEYEFTSSRPDVGNFVEPNLASTERNAILLNSKSEPTPGPALGAVLRVQQR